jgi:hypothetical protein
MKVQNSTFKYKISELCVQNGPRDIFHQNCLKTAPTQSKIDYANFEPLLVNLTIRSCS